MDCSMPGFPVHHQLPEPAQTHVCQPPKTALILFATLSFVNCKLPLTPMLRFCSLVHQLIVLRKALLCLLKMQKRTQTISLNIHSSLLLLVIDSLNGVGRRCTVWLEGSSWTQITIVQSSNHWIALEFPKFLEF